MESRERSHLVARCVDLANQITEMETERRDIEVVIGICGERYPAAIGLTLRYEHLRATIFGNGDGGGLIRQLSYAQTALNFLHIA